MDKATSQDDGLKRNIPEHVFSTENYDLRKQFPHFEELVSPIVGVGIDAPAEQGFRARISGYDLGQLHFATCSIDSFFYERSAELVRKSNLDHWCLVFRRSGFEMSRAGDAVLSEPAGTLALKSLATPMTGSCSETEMVMVFLQRDAFQDLSELVGKTSHTILTGRLAEIVKTLIMSVYNYLPNMTYADIPVVVNSLSSLLSGSIRMTLCDLDLAGEVQEASQFEMAKKYIQANLKRPELNPAAICTSLGISRRQLYYLFEHYGGVAKYIRSRRLAACHAAIENIADHRRISSIAYEYGYSSASQFSRQYRAEFGYTPKETLDGRIRRIAEAHNKPRTFSEWLHQVREPVGSRQSGTK